MMSEYRETREIGEKNKSDSLNSLISLWAPDMRLPALLVAAALVTPVATSTSPGSSSSPLAITALATPAASGR
jgi:hypothetical protein